MSDVVRPERKEYMNNYYYKKKLLHYLTNCVEE